MTVLVDEARWRWRGRLWAHLVSDESFEELHEVARLIGKRRLGFQGDHYDVDSVDRERALEAGAVAVDSRQLVRRLVAAGLRRAGAKPSWTQVGSSPAGSDPAPVVSRLAELGGSGPARLVEAVGEIEPIATLGSTGAWRDEHRVVVLIDLASGLSAPAPGRWFELPDEVVLGEPRADGERSVELFAAR